MFVVHKGAFTLQGRLTAVSSTLTSGVRVSSVQSNMLNGIVGQTVMFPAAVKEIDYIFKDGSVIAKVVNQTIQLIKDSYGTRLQWNSSTGLFSLSDLRRGDSGGYRVQHKDGKTDDYQLVVWDPVPRPQVSSRNKMKPNCSVLCSVENGREVTLSWKREGQTLSHTSSPNFSSPLSLPLEIEMNSAPYSCVATNPVSNKTVTVRPEEHCFDPVPRPQVSSRNKMKPNCSVLCSVENGREVTLSWKREGQTLSHTSSPNFSSPLSLPLEIETNSAPYSCVATNPVSNKTVTVRPEEHCFDPVPRPQVSSRNKMKPNCSVLCSVENGRGVTLSWHREGQTLSHTSSPNFSSPLSLPLEIETNSAPYSCVATNPVSNKTVTVRPEEHCFDPVPRPQVSSRNKMKPNCSVLCSVENGKEVTLSWHREGQTLSHTSSPNFSSPLSLPLEIEENSAPYGCMAANPASNETVTVRPEEHCFDPVPRPQMSSRNKMKPSCSVLCSVENGREVTLSWHREGQTLSHTSSANFSSPLSLPLEIEMNSAPYSCVATNPVSNKTVIVRPEEHCFDRDIRSLLVAGIEAFIGILFIILMGTYVCLLIRSNTPGS
ncbi:titin-like [Anguilla anguilla]|uniref:titin-like n=1 Tax=Anguilla anguilla TaxID=7936 RepID=UPI0015AB1A96|nr:titin-like [Anguilla anguilla]